jgi:hypothetical protein
MALRLRAGLLALLVVCGSAACAQASRHHHWHRRALKQNETDMPVADLPMLDPGGGSCMGRAAPAAQLSLLRGVTPRS